MNGFLVIDNDPVKAAAYIEMIELMGLSVCGLAESVFAGVHLAQTERPTAVLINADVPHAGSALGLFDVPRIFLGAVDGAGGTARVLERPVLTSSFITAVEEALTQAAAAQEREAECALCGQRVAAPGSS
jgi:hypothetical protein